MLRFNLNAIPFQFLDRFNFVKIVLFLSTHSGHCWRLLNVAFAFKIVINRFCLLNEKGKVLQCFELWVFPTVIRIVYHQLNLKNLWKKLNLPNSKKLYRIHFILLFDIFYWLYLLYIVYIYFIDTVYFP